ncbi:hypothetical protein J8J14_02870 [Roseomonas sp. SSH11]|uniref:Uncharacterized protein n=1 Tax=Pararoseomonas baculiformis TaxID=2820812 RepID=A0ABS4AAY8_9PROT|nr:hypothetical protein [Pararoseomonas baculiformis]MBP0443710.1 hypothetical protein [Pararoseomonas baculiformis]
MPVLPIRRAKPLRPDHARLGPQEARREAALLTMVPRHRSRFPGDGGRVLPMGGPAASRGLSRQAGTA